LSVDLLKNYSYKSDLGLSLKRSLRHFDKDALLEELFTYADWLDSLDIISQVSLDFRIKAYESIENKYNRYYPNVPASKVFNDILGFRAFCDSYSDLLSNDLEFLRMVDMSNGKANDDGYRGVHAYYQLDNFHYPIEIQFNTLVDRQINNWLHDYLYKKDLSLECGRILRQKYDEGKIKNENDFEEALYDLLSGKK
jgi:putative GTP pyrophosphokinase